MGATLASSGLELSGIVQGAAPAIILIPANIILGTMIGLRFKGISLSELRASLVDGLAGFIIAMVMPAVTAHILSHGVPVDKPLGVEQER